MAAPWDFVQQASLGAENPEGYNTFLTNRVLSSNTKFFSMRLLSYINSIDWSSVPEDVRAKITANLIRKLPKFSYKYIKNAKVVKSWQDEDVQILMLRLKCSETDAKEYITEGFISQDTIDKLKEEGYYE